MSQLLSYKNTGGEYTSSEIISQPKTWENIWEKILSKKEAITSFLKEIVKLKELNIVLTGAGSSAFIGDTALMAWLSAFSKPTQAIPTTDLVTHFKQRTVPDKPLLLISFARSGNSPESTAAVNRADQYCSQVFHLVITCNPEGKLAQLDNRDDTFVFLLPSEAEDKGLAMTNSFTSMALTAILIPKLFVAKNKVIEKQVDMLAKYGEAIIEDKINLLYTVSKTDFDRIIFLGSGPLWGIAKESQLKVQELTNGTIIGKFDSFLGFRHGPKAAINEKTLLVYLLSNNEEVQQYEEDLINQISKHDVDLTSLVISESTFTSSKTDFVIELNDTRELQEDFWSIACALPGQIIGFFKSLALNYDPDNPSPNGTISRVVEGVKIYDGSQINNRG